MKITIRKNFYGDLENSRGYSHQTFPIRVSSESFESNFLTQVPYRSHVVTMVEEAKVLHEFESLTVFSRSSCALGVHREFSTPSGKTRSFRRMVSF